MKRLTVMLAFIVFAGVSLLQAQTVQITGTVTSSEDGEPIPGVSVVVKGTTIGTTSDYDGTYSLAVPEDANTLVYSFVGMKTLEVPIEGQTTIDVVMDADVLQVDELVVTALGLNKEAKALGYSVQEVDAEEIGNSSATNVLNSLSGKVAGVTINSSAGTAGASSFIEIRGATSLLGSNRPLFVVDGVPIDGGGGSYTTGTTGDVANSDRIGDLNMDDIAQVSVLKGGAATALYGLRAANGAIIITTKKGTATAGKKINVNFHSNASLSQISQVPELNDEYAQGSIMGHQWYNDVYGLNVPYIMHPDGAGFINTSWGPKISGLSYATDPTYVPADYGTWAGATPMDEYREKWNPNGRIVNADSPFANGQPVQVYDPYDYFQTGIQYNNSLSLSGGDEKTTFYTSFSNTTEESVVPNNTYVKNTFKISGQTKLSEKWALAGDMNYLNNSGNYIQQGSNISGVMLGLLRTPPTFDNSFGYRFADGSQRTYRGGGGYDNPYWTSNEISYDEDVNRLIGNMNVNFFATDWMSFTYKIGTDWYSQRYKDYFEIGSNNWPDGLLRNRQIYSQDINSDLLMNITRDLTPDIGFDLTLGNNIYQRAWTWTQGNANGLTIMDWNNLANTSDLVATEANYKKRTAAFFGDLGLSYKEMVFLSVTGRQEWSTTLPEGNNSFFYPSVSGSFVLTEIPALNGSRILPFAKLRASYAVLALDATAYSLDAGYYVPAPGDGWTSGIEYPLFGYAGFMRGITIGDENLTPEEQKAIEFGVDLKFVDNRVRFDVTYFINKNEDLLLSAPIAASSGYDSYYRNAATMESKGFEILAGVTPVKTNDFTWDINANFANPQSEVTSLAEGVDNVPLNVGFVDPQFHAIVGEPYRTIWGTQWLKDDQGRLIINDGAAYAPVKGYPIQDAQSGILGSVPENWRLGLSNTFKYKGLSLSALLEVKNGGQMWNGTKGALYYFGTHADTESRDTESKTFEGVYGYQADDGSIVYTDADGNDLAEGATPVSNNFEVPLDENWYFWEGPGSGFTGPSEQFIEDTDWVRLRQVTLSYALPSSILNNTFIGRLEVYVSGRNLYLDTPYTGIDPETSLFGTSNAQGADYFNMPGTKSYTFGLRVGF